MENNNNFNFAVLLLMWSKRNLANYTFEKYIYIYIYIYIFHSEILFSNRLLGVTCEVKRKVCVKTIRSNAVTTTNRVCPIFMNCRSEFHFRKPSSKREFCENRLSDSHTLTNRVFSTVLDRLV